MDTDPSLRFAIDRMVIKLGTYLRILGYDAIWNSRRRPHELIGQANQEQRVFCTRNRHIPHEYIQPAAMLVVSSPAPVEQLRQVIELFRMDPQRHLFSRCIRCNRVLEQVFDRERIREQVHPSVYARFNRFYLCPSCHTVFWHGSHVRNTCRKLGLDKPVEGGQFT